MRPTANFCPSCGKGVAICDQCGADNRRTARFCKKCGKLMPDAEQGRLA
ncbi:MAG: zinc ribbon domain-containing protein [Methanotrichaceae archaeon]|nr:zinc ribbon domain-containing protein [Methanotrichaceae archaeon]